MYYFSEILENEIPVILTELFTLETVWCSSVTITLPTTHPVMLDYGVIQRKEVFHGI
jgi:hypothetical protein